MTLLLALFVALFATTAGLVFLLQPRKADDRLRRRLQAIKSASRLSTTAIGPAQGSQEPLSAKEGVSRRLESRLATQRWSAWIPTLLRESGSSLSPTIFLSLSGAFAVSSLIAGTLAHADFLPTIALAAFTISLPTLWQRHRRSKRLAALEEVLPDSIDLMSRALQAGHSVQQMIEVSSEQAREPMRSELALVHREQILGLPLRDTLLNMVQRVPSQDLRFLVTAILIQKETGGDLIAILERTSHIIRERIRVAGEVRTYTAQGRLTGWILTALPIILLGVIWLITPAYVAVFFHDPVGRKLLYGGAFLLLTGGGLIRRVTRVEI